MNKRTVLIWSIYDFANSIASILVALYFSLLIVKDFNKSDLYVSLPVVVSTIFLILTLPYFGSIADKHRRYKPILFITTLMCILSLAAMGWFAFNANTSFYSFAALIIFYFLFEYFYLAALAFYFPFMQILSEKVERSFVASIGLAAGMLGSLIGIVIGLAVNKQGVPIIFITGSVCFAICFVLFQIYFTENNTSKINAQNFFPKSFKEFFAQLISLKDEKNVLRYLIGYILFSDAILTLQLFLSLYLSKSCNLSTNYISASFIIGLFTAFLGALFTPKFLKLVGNIKTSLLTAIIVWSILLFLLALINNLWQVFIVLALNGFWFGLLFGISRVMYSKIIPVKEPAKYFSFYVLFERFASIIGPLLWSISAYIFSFTGEENKYRFAVGMLAILVLISFLILKDVKEEYRSTPNT